MSDTFAAFIAEKTDDGFRRGVRELTLDDLPEGEVVVDVEWSSVNYKDHLAAIEKGRVARSSPLVPGIDLAGTVRSSTSPDFQPGDRVIAGDAELGVSHHGGFSQVARVPADFVTRVPDGLTTREAMLIGTGGFTAAMSVIALIDHGVTPDAGTILVTGATGGVGSMAVAMLAQLGYTVAASTGKPDAASFLRELGASEIVDRNELVGASKPLLPIRWASAVDAVGGDTLAHVLATLGQDGLVAASGNVGGFELHTTVMPFILRGVTLAGIDSAHMDISRRRALWERVATDLRPPQLDAMERVVDLEHLEDALDEIGRGGVTGRYVVEL
jgi:putative YhdH/YhfP family quinone oxidoreductase